MTILYGGKYVAVVRVVSGLPHFRSRSYIHWKGYVLAPCYVVLRGKWTAKLYLSVVDTRKMFGGTE